MYDICFRELVIRSFTAMQKAETTCVLIHTFLNVWSIIVSDFASIWFRTNYFPLISCFSWFLISNFKQILFSRFPGSQGQGEVVICHPGILYLILDKLINASAVQTYLEKYITFTFPFNLQILNVSSNPQILQIVPPSLRKEAWKYLFARLSIIQRGFNVAQKNIVGGWISFKFS